MSTLTPEDLRRLSRAVERIAELDKTAEWIGRDIDNAGEWGDKVRSILGRNRMAVWQNDFLGQVMACAVMTELMRERDEIAESLEGLIELTPRPMPDQEPDRENR